MRKRGFVPEIWHDRKTLRWNHELLLFFMAMFTAVDDKGRTHNDPMELSAKLCRWRPHQIEKLLAELVEDEVIELYGEEEGKPPKYLHVVHFNRHQYISKSTGSTLPIPPSEQPKLPLNDVLKFEDTGESDKP